MSRHRIMRRSVYWLYLAFALWVLALVMLQLSTS